jgi:uncharacterized protein (DUF302 family)
MPPVKRTLLRARPGTAVRRHRVGLVAGMVVLALGASACADTSGSGRPTEAPSSPPAASGQASVRLMTATSSTSFEATTAALKKAATAVLRKDPSQPGSMVLGDVNQARILSRRTDLRIGGAQVFLVGNPAVAQNSFRADRAIGTVIPHRMYVWREPDGTTKISYLDPGPLFTAIDPELAETGTTMSTKLATIAENAAGAAPRPASGQASVPLMTVTSDRSFADTNAAFQRSVSQAGSTVLGELNQAQVLSRRAGLHVEGAHTYFVGNPAMGKQVFQIDRAVGTVVPLRMYVWQDRDGTTKIAYLDPGPLFTAINPQLADYGKKMSSKLNTIARNAT